MFINERGREFQKGISGYPFCRDIAGGKCRSIFTGLTTRGKSTEGRSQVCSLVLVPSLLVGMRIEFQSVHMSERSHGLLESISGH